MPITFPAPLLGSAATRIWCATASTGSRPSSVIIAVNWSATTSRPFWRVTGANEGEFSTDPDQIGASGSAQGSSGASTFANFSIKGGTDDDTYLFDLDGELGLGIAETAGGVDVLVGSVDGATTDTFAIQANGDIIFIPSGALTSTTVEGIENIDGTFSAANIGPDTGDDVITIAAGTTWGGDILTAAGSDSITFGDGAEVSGIINTGSGTDTVDLSA